MRKIPILFVATLALLAPSPASAAIKISLVGVSDWDRPNADTGSNYAVKAGFGGGTLLAFPLLRHLDLEVGGLYITRKYDDTTIATTVSSHAIQVPVLFRAWLHPLFSVGAGGYGAFAVGQIHLAADDGSSASTASYEERGLKKSDYGVLLSVATRLPLSRRLNLLIDGRYALGLSNVNNQTGSALGTSFKYRDIQALVGVRF